MEGVSFEGVLEVSLLFVAALSFPDEAVSPDEAVVSSCSEAAAVSVLSLDASVLSFLLDFDASVLCSVSVSVSSAS